MDQEIKIVGTSFAKATEFIKDDPDFGPWAETLPDGSSFGVFYRLIPEPENQFDPNAVRVEMRFVVRPDQWVKVGYLPKGMDPKSYQEKLALPEFKGRVMVFNGVANYSFYFNLD